MNMKHRIGRYVSLLLALSFLVSLGALSVSAEGGKKEYHSYVAFGDSICVKDAEHLYPELVAGELGASFQNCGKTGWRTHEMRIILEDYEGDAYTENFLKHREWAGQTKESVIGRRDTYREYIRNADLISLEFGTNDLLGIFAYYLYEYVGADFGDVATDYGKVLDELLNGLKSEDPQIKLETMGQVIKLMGGAAKFASAFLAKLPTIQKEFRENWDRIITDIRGLNPDADIVAIGMYNNGTALASMISDLLGLPLEALMATMIDPINYYIRYGSPHCTEYAYADITGIDLSDSEDHNHPGQAGHEYICAQVLSALRAYKPCAHTHTVLLHEKKKTLLQPGYSGDVVCTDCGAVVEQGSILVGCLTVPLPKNIGAAIVSTVSKAVQKLGSIFGK